MNSGCLKADCPRNGKKSLLPHTEASEPLTRNLPETLTNPAHSTSPDTAPAFLFHPPKSTTPSASRASQGHLKGKYVTGDSHQCSVCTCRFQLRSLPDTSIHCLNCTVPPRAAVLWAQHKSHGTERASCGAGLYFARRTNFMDSSGISNISCSIAPGLHVLEGSFLPTHTLPSRQGEKNRCSFILLSSLQSQLQ